MPARQLIKIPLPGPPRSRRAPDPRDRRGVILHLLTTLAPVEETRGGWRGQVCKQFFIAYPQVGLGPQRPAYRPNRPEPGGYQIKANRTIGVPLASRSPRLPPPPPGSFRAVQSTFAVIPLPPPIARARWAREALFRPRRLGSVPSKPAPPLPPFRLSRPRSPLSLLAPPRSRLTASSFRSQQRAGT